MHVIRRRGWEIPERVATPEHIFLQPPCLPGGDRRRRAGAVAGAGFGAARRRPAGPEQRVSIRSSGTRTSRSTAPSPTRRSTPTTTISTSSARPSRWPRGAGPQAAAMDGQDRRHGREAAGDRHRRSPQEMPLEERLYRHRCVEAWSMAIPWSGFPLAKLVELAKPLSSAKYLRMETFFDKTMAPEQRKALPSVALYRRADDGGGDQRARLPGDRRLRQAGVESAGCAAAARGAVEVRFQVDQIDHQVHLHRSAAEELSGRRCRRRNTASGPTSIRRCAHPRWSQATEEVIGTNKRVPTQLFNGYGE